MTKHNDEVEERRLWSKQQIKAFVKSFYQLHPPQRFKYLTDEAFRAFIDAEVLMIVCSNGRSTLPVAGIIQLRADLYEAFNLEV